MKIFAYVDRSRFAESVCLHAVWASRQLGLPIEIIHAINPESSASSHDYSGYQGLDLPQSALEERVRLDEQNNRERIETARQYMDAVADRVLKQEVEAVSQRLYQGTIVDHLRENAGECFLAIVGKRGEGSNQSSQHLGSNVESLVRSAHRPVMVVSPEFVPVERALMAWDGGASSGKAINLLANWPLLAGVPISILHVSDNPKHRSDSLEDAKQHLESAGNEASTRIVPGPVAGAILGEVQDSASQMLVMGAYGHSRVRQLIIGSVTTEILSRLDISVLIFH